MSKVVCKTKRIGGGFGGKETRSAFIAAAAAVPSYLLGRPVKITIDRDVDMMITGQRHSFFGKYKVFDKQQEILCTVQGNSIIPYLPFVLHAIFAYCFPFSVSGAR